jgi:hypothetical protein
MSHPTNDHSAWVFEQSPASSTRTAKTRRAQHISGHKRVSADGDDDTLIFDKLNHRGYDPSTFEISHVEVNDDTRVGGLCGAMGGLRPSAEGGWAGFARNAFRRLFCRDDKPSQPLSSPTFDSMLDSFHDGSTAKWSNAYKPQSSSTDSRTSSGYSTESSTDSESYMVREENRRWRRGF